MATQSVKIKMKEFVRPRIVISKCLEFEPVRYDAQMIPSEFVRQLKSHVDFIPVCPEVEIGLGIPRDPIRIVKIDEQLRLIQPSTNLDVTDKMQSFIKSFLDSLEEVDGFILKNRSPTSGLNNIKVYPSTENVAPIGRTSGFFGGAVLGRFPDLAIEDEGRLKNSRIKEHFLRKLFTIASFRKVKASNSINELIKFHSENKLLLSAYNQEKLRVLGRIVADQKKRTFSEVISDYQKNLFEALKRPPRCGSTINVMMHNLGYFSRGLSKEEKSFFLDLLEKYRKRKLPLSTIIGILKSWNIRFKEDYLMNQTFFEPYPEELVDPKTMTEYCDEKDYWSEN